MPSKKTANTEPSDSKRHTAPKLPENLAKNIKSDSSSDGQRIVVRKLPKTKTDQQPLELPVPTIDNLDSPENNQAVDDIMSKESDMILAVDDIMAGKRAQVIKQPGLKEKLLSILRNKWTWAGILLVLCFIFALPFTRYKLLGIFIKEKVNLIVIDSQTNTPVSNTQISLAGSNVKTDGEGQAIINLAPGNQTIILTKQYYKTANVHYFVGFKDNKKLTVKLIATGRLVPVTINNIINGKPLAEATIHILNTTAKTNNKGQATIALPTKAASYKASISLTNYNTKQTNVQVTNLSVPSNVFTLTPAGSVYFLSNQNGTVNVVKSNLDGTNRQVILEGTGHENAATTRLLVSSDWHYLVLEANRSGSGPALYLINTTNDQVTEFDSSNSMFNLIGWYGHDFIYSLTSNSDNQWQADSQVLKEYNADQKELNQLDKNQASGNGSSYAYQYFSNFFLIGSNVVYDTEWSTPNGYDISSDTDTIRVFELNTQTKKDYESFPANTTGSIDAARYRLQIVYFAVTSINKTAAYYQYENQDVETSNINQTIFNQSNPTYLLSPSGNQAVWYELSSGHNLFFIGNSNGGSQQQIAALNDYVPYGWYSDKYILASKGNDQLYILPASGLSGVRQPLKIATYYEPDSTNNTYEYGGF